MRTMFFASLCLAAACSSDPPSPATVRARLTSDLGNVLHETQNASDGSTAHLPGSATASLLGVSTTMANVMAGDPDKLIQWLNDHVFTDANYLGDGTYKVPPELVCSTDDTACAQRLELAQLRVRVEEDDNHALRFAVQIDPNHDEPLSFLLAHTELAVTLDLDGADHAIISLAELFGEQAPNVDLQGQATADLQILGSAHAKASLSIDRAIMVAVAPQGEPLSGNGAWRFASTAAQVIAIELDGNAPLATLDLGLGETLVHVPGDATTKSTDVDLAGLTANAAFAGGNTLTIQHISLGGKTTTIAKDMAVGEMIDLNPNDGRSLQATITADPNSGIETLIVAPRLDLERSIDHAILGDAPPVYDVTRVLLDGALQSTASSSQVRVLTGTLSLATNPAPYGFSATAGQCIAQTQAYDATSAQPYTAYSVGSCP